MNLPLQVAIAIGVAWAALQLLCRAGRLPVNLPNERSLHRLPIPRGGGLSIWAGWLCATLPWYSPQLWQIPLIALIAVSMLDDRYQLGVAARIAVQFMATAFWIWTSGPIVGAIASFAVILWAMNLYNFMDGSDGLAGLMTVTGFTAYAAAACLGGDAAAPMLFALVAVALPFLKRNLPPATVFLGDSGSVPLGFLAGTLGIDGISRGLWPVWFPVLVFLPFVADATVTLARRTLRGERIWEAHRGHYYQRLVRLGFGHAGVLALYGAMMVGTAMSALAALERAPASGPTLLCVWVAVHLVAFSAIDYVWRRSDIGSHASKC